MVDDVKTVGEGIHRLPSHELVLGLGVLLACQLIGEIAVGLLRVYWPSFVFPGPVIGMILLLVILTRRRTAPGVMPVGDAMMGMFSLLFVPAAVGIVQHGSLVLQWAGPLAVALLLSTTLTLLVTVGTYLAVERWIGGGVARD
jgi:Putative effector of murein hydrolase LrgA